MTSLSCFDAKEIRTYTRTVAGTTWRSIFIKDSHGNELEIVIFGSKKDLKIKEEK